MSAPKPSPPGDAHLPKHPSPLSYFGTHVWEQFSLSMSLPDDNWTGLQASNCFSDLGSIYSDQHWSTTIYFFETITKPLKKLLYFLIARKYQLYINTFTYLFNFSFKSRSCSHLPRQLHHPETEVLVRTIVLKRNCYKKNKWISKQTTNCS